MAHGHVLYVCSPPGILGWLNVALAKGTLGVWHDAQVVPKWFAGAAWHDAHEVLRGCVNAQLLPALRWQFWHAPAEWLAGRAWQFAQVAPRDGCENVQLLPGFRWQVWHEPSW